jgi:epoxyqueuosine reductase
MLDISLKEKALSIGFDLYGVTKSIIPEKAQNDFKEFIKNKYYGSMSWFPERQDIRNNFLNLGLEPKSAICLGVIYNSINHKNIVKNIKISRYATGKDYHKILKGMGKEFINFLKIRFPSSKFRQGVDTLPISEKVLSENAGLGWLFLPIEAL